MKATVMTTGPGVIIATATASKNWCSFSQPNCCTTPCCKNGMIARPLPNTNAPALVKNNRICSQYVATNRLSVAALTEPGLHQPNRPRRASRRRISLAIPASNLAMPEKPGRSVPARMKNSASSACDHTVTAVSDDEDAPEQRITLVGAAGELVSGNGNDGDDRGADRIEERLHPPQVHRKRRKPMKSPPP